MIYFLFVVMVTLPLDGWLLHDNFWLGIGLLLMQVPYLYNITKEIEGKDCAKIY